MIIYRHFRTQVLLRVSLLTLTLAGAALAAFGAQAYGWGIVLVLVGLYQAIIFTRYVEKTNRDLSRLLLSIRYSDFSQSFLSGGRGGSFAELTSAFREVMEDFRLARAEKEEGYRYLETVMHHVPIGMVSFSADGTVSLVNSAAKRLLRLTHIKNIEALREVSPDLVDTLFSLSYGGKALVPVVQGEDTLHLSLHATGFKLRNEMIKLVSIHDIGGELEEMEAEAWQKLTRVLTHEIMNSVAPISSLAATASTLLDDLPGEAEAVDDIRGAVETIARRSQGLLSFVQAYRRMTRVPPPTLAPFRLSSQFDSLLELFDAEIQKRGVRLVRSVVPEALEIVADRELIDQVLINLLRNALDALVDADDPVIRLEAYIDARSHAVVQVVDNGSGIVKEALDTIFVPFFTTKREGSGIGLSLSREIMRQHGGSISAQSTPGVRTAIRLRF